MFLLMGVPDLFGGTNGLNVLISKVPVRPMKNICCIWNRGEDVHVYSYFTRGDSQWEAGNFWVLMGEKVMGAQEWEPGEVLRRFLSLQKTLRSCGCSSFPAPQAGPAVQSKLLAHGQQGRQFGESLN